MNRMIYIFLIFVSCNSCSYVGDYYVEKGSSGREDIQIGTESSRRKIALVAQNVESKFNVILYVKYIDTINVKKVQLEQIYFTVNNLTSEGAHKILECIDTANIEYKDIKGIPRLKERLVSGLPLEFVYSFDKDKLENSKEIIFSLRILINENDNKQSWIKKDFKMVKRKRYRSWFARS